MTANPKNPFIISHRIKRPYFCDREVEQKRLTSAIVNGRNMVLISPRRMGKTSLAYVSLYDDETIREEYTLCFFDILQTNTLGEFTYLFGKSVFDSLQAKGESLVKGFLAALKSLRGSFGFDPVSGAPSFDIQLGDIRHPEYTLEEIFGYIEECRKPMIIVIDEFQQITKYPEKNAEAVLRSQIQRLSNATFLFAGSERSILQEMFLSTKRPFYGSCEIMNLGPIPEEVYIEFAQNMFSERERSIDPEGVSWSFRLFDGNTYCMQRAMNGAFASTHQGEICDKQMVVNAVREMIESSEVLYREILSNISIKQKNLLYAIAKDRVVTNPMSGDFIRRHALVSASSVQSALQKLIKGGYITNGENGYSVGDPLLRVFINGIYGVPELPRL